MTIVCQFSKIEKKTSYKSMVVMKMVPLMLLNILNRKIRSRKKGCINFSKRGLRNGLNKRKELTLQKQKYLRNAQAFWKGQITHFLDKLSHLSEAQQKNGLRLYKKTNQQ